MRLILTLLEQFFLTQVEEKKPFTAERMGKKSTKKKKDKPKNGGKNILGKGLSRRLEKAVKQHGAEVVTELVTALIAAYVGSRKKRKTEAKLAEAAKAAIGKEADAAIETIHQSSHASKDPSATPNAVVLVKVEISDQTVAAPTAEVTSVSLPPEEASPENISDNPQENEKQQA